jgi:hypothetical protein
MARDVAGRTILAYAQTPMVTVLGHRGPVARKNVAVMTKLHTRPRSVTVSPCEKSKPM